MKVLELKSVKEAIEEMLKGMESEGSLNQREDEFYQKWRDLEGVKK